MRSIFLITTALLCFINPLFGQGSTNTSDQPTIRMGQKKGKKGAYTEWDMKTKHPLTMFNNANEMGDDKFEELILKLRDEFDDVGSPSNAIYAKIYGDAVHLATNDDHTTTGVNQRSQKAKHFAFVYLIG